MSNDTRKNSAAVFLDAHPDLRRTMLESKIFAEIKQHSALKVNDEHFYVVRGDTLGDEDELFLDALAKGAKSPVAENSFGALFLELTEAQRRLLTERFKI